MPAYSPFRYKDPFIPVFPQESLPVAGKTADRGLSYLKAVIETLGCKIDLTNNAPGICVKGTDGSWQVRPLKSIENNFLGFKVVYADNGEKDTIFSSPAREINLLTDWIIRNYNPDPQKIEFEYLQILNAGFIMEHGDLDEKDYEKIFKAQVTMAMLRTQPSAHTTLYPGDTLRGAYYDGKFPFTRGLVVQRPQWAEKNDTKIHFCAEPYIPFICKNGGMDCSGGPWFSAEKKHFSFLGEGERLFQVFGHAGVCGNGAIEFPCRSNTWQLDPAAGI